MTEQTPKRDRELGMHCPIARRDFLGGALLGGAALAVGLGAAAPGEAPQDEAGYYPPLLNGLRGSHPGSFEAAHRLRDGDFWATAGATPGARENYDLVIVGGISGLSAAYFYRAQHPNARILILENHDDFGGHAKRNEFRFGPRMSLMNGGTLEIDSPYPYSKVADGLLRALGIDPPALEKACTDEDFYASRGMGTGIFFQREVFGADRLVAGLNKKPFSELLKNAPLSERVKQDVARVFAGKGAHMPGMDDAQKKDRLSRISYGRFLSEVMHVDPGVIPVFQQYTHDEWGVGIDAVPALDAWGFGYPGFDDLQLKPGRAPRMGYTGGGYADGGSYKFHFPDGNATIARLLVRSLVPGVLEGKSAADIVTSPADYARLDRPGNQVRIRLSSIVVGARNIGSPSQSQGVDVVYTRFGQLHQVRAKQCVLACWNMMIPYLCPEMPAVQKAGLHYLVKTPLVYTSVAIRNWRAFEKLGVSTIYAPAGYWVTIRLNPVTNIGAYHSVASPDDPVLVFLVRTPCHPGLDERSQNRFGRAEMLATTFTTFERNIRDEMGRALGAGGFDPARDITAITVNRWPHGYAYEYNSLFDPDWAPGQAPNEIGRKPFGKIVIANSDSGAGAYTSVAIDQAHRAITELAHI